MEKQRPLELLTQVNRSRAVAAGLDVYLYDTLASGAEDFDDWRQRFRDRGRWFARHGHESAQRNRLATAREAFETAALCFHYATCVPGGTRDEISGLLLEAAEMHREALKAAGRSFVRFAPEQTQGLFYGLLERPDRENRVPVVIIVPGLDSSKEEFDRIAAALRERGLATLRIDGPGQGEMLATSGPTTTYEQVLTAAVDTLAAQPGLDMNRVGAVGLSLGGYYVPRAIAFEPRVRAAVAVTGVYSLPPWSDIPGMLREILILRCGREPEAQLFARSINLEGLAPTIQQPLWVVCGNADPVVAPDDARRLAREAPHAELVEVSEGDHLGANRRWQWQARMADWIANRL